MKYTSFVVMMAAVLAVLLAAGCTSAPVKETSTTNVSTTEPPVAVKYVELNMVDGTKGRRKICIRNCRICNNSSNVCN